MKFILSEAIKILSRTPDVLFTLLKDLDDDWIFNNEGPQTWSPFDVVGHLIHGEKTDWMVRVKIIMSDNTDKSFYPFDRFAQFEESKGKTLDELLNQFKDLRRKNLEILMALSISDQDLEKTGIHPEFGTVSLKQLLATWVVHDLSHIGQVSRVMCKNYQEAVGPWSKYLKVFQS